MNKLFFFTLIILLPLIAESQVCVTLYQGDDFGIEDRLNSIKDIEMDPLGNMWFVAEPQAGLGGQLSQIGILKDESVWTLLDSAFNNDNTFHDLAFDKDDSVWIAMDAGLGIFNIHTLEGRIMNPPNSELPDERVTAVAVDQNNVKWIGFQSGKVAEYHDGSFVVHDNLGSIPVRTIEVAKDGSVWVGRANNPGIMVFSSGEWIPKVDLDRISVIRADKWDRVLVASGDSLIIYKGNETKVLHPSKGQLINGIEVGEGGRIWTSTAYSLFLLSGGQFIPFSHTNSEVPSNITGPIRFDSKNQLWFGYRYKNGLERTGTGYLYRPDLQEKAVITTDSPSLIFCYGDSLTLSAQEDQASYVWPDGSNTDSYRLYEEETVEVAVERNDGCFYYDTLDVEVQKVYEEEKVCAVSVDTGQKNIIIWEKTPAVGTDSYNIFRETEVTDSFAFIGNVPVGRLSVFVDPEVDPRVKSVKYKISSIDTCGNESGPSFYHRTLHLTVNEGAQHGQVNLIWTHYEGLNFPTYYIYRGSSPDKLVKYDSIASSNTQWVDVQATDTLYYVLAFPIPDVCRPSGNLKEGTGPYYHSLSNMDDNKKLLFIGKKKVAMEIHSYPNPFVDVTRIEYPDLTGEEHMLRVYNLSGKQVHEIGGITGGEVYFERGNLQAGYYVFELRGKKLYRGKFIIQ